MLAAFRCLLLGATLGQLGLCLGPQVHADVGCDATAKAAEKDDIDKNGRRHDGQTGDHQAVEDLDVRGLFMRLPCWIHHAAIG